MSSKAGNNRAKQTDSASRSTTGGKRAQHKMLGGKMSGQATKPQNPKPKAPAQSDRQEPSSQFTLKMRESLHQELARLAFDKGMTMRGFIMNALKSKGLSITESDLRDRRRK